MCFNIYFVQMVFLCVKGTYLVVLLNLMCSHYRLNSYVISVTTDVLQE